MATSSVGSSSIDVNQIVSSLVANKRAAKDKQIAENKSQVTTQLTAIGTLTSALSALDSAIKGLSDGTAFKTNKTSVSDTSILSATSDSGAQPNAYKIVVDKLATAQKTSSPALGDAKRALGTGSLTISVGGKSMTLHVKSDANTLENIRDSINKAKDNPGVTASIVNGSDGAHLVLSSSNTGAANAFTVTTSGGDGGLDGLAFDPSKDTPTVKAQDASFTVDGLSVTSASNTVSNAIDGVTLTLSKAGESTVTVANDPDATVTAMQALVSAYNNFQSSYKTLTMYDKAHKQVGALIGDATITSIKGQMSQILGTQVHDGGDGPHSMSDLGLSFQVDGTLKLDTSKLKTQLANHPRETQDLVSGEKGIAGKLDKAITGWTASNGILTLRTNNLNKKSDDLDDQSADLDTKMDAYGKQLTKQYTALDNLMTKLGSTGSFLQQQFAALSAKQ
ncbi:flagellar hook-associated protein 2 [Luteibacter sp. 621]|uniref:flagellar filament capping protein FliD n=1 Tax=Luteibacter sp. 621 TaxID=3373916 RepID=UPI003D19102B